MCVHSCKEKWEGGGGGGGGRLFNSQQATMTGVLPALIKEAHFLLYDSCEQLCKRNITTEPSTHCIFYL